jgi:hypothetical protein
VTDPNRPPWAYPEGGECRTLAAGAISDLKAALMLLAARLRHITGTRLGIKRHLNINLIKKMLREEVVA